MPDCGERNEAKGLCHRHYQRLKYRRDPEKFRLAERVRRERDPEGVRAQERARHAANPWIKRTGSTNRKAMVRGAPGRHTAKEWRGLLERWGGRCAYCSAPATTKDHVIPIARGGTNDITNLVPACMSCNARKGARTPEEWRAALTFLDD